LDNDHVSNTRKERLPLTTFEKKLKIQKVNVVSSLRKQRNWIKPVYIVFFLQIQDREKARQETERQNIQKDPTTARANAINILTLSRKLRGVEPSTAKSNTGTTAPVVTNSENIPATSTTGNTPFFHRQIQPHLPPQFKGSIIDAVNEKMKFRNSFIDDDIHEEDEEDEEEFDEDDYSFETDQYSFTATMSEKSENDFFPLTPTEGIYL
jgi:hypothetical protein